MAKRLELVGTAEIEERHGIPRYKVFRLIDRGDFPAPYQELRCGSIWDASEVAAAARRLGANTRRR